MGRANWLIITSLFLAGVMGCDDEETDCSYVANPCDALGDTQCSPDGRDIEICGLSYEGCLHWISDETCDTAMACSAEGGAPECVCVDACEAEGELQCDGDVVQTCALDDQGCRFWVDIEDCSDDDQSCVENGDDASCTECADLCGPSGASRCSGTVVQTCQTGTSGCLEWVGGVNCADTDEVCDDSGDEVGCAANCDDACDAADETRCDGEIIQTCASQPDGCLGWEGGTDCAALEPAQYCDDTGDTAVCVEECVNRCTPSGSTRCDGDVIQTCEEQAGGCLGWTDTQDCSLEAPAQTCDDTDEPVCVDLCVDECMVEDETRCADERVETCLRGAESCLAWVLSFDCGAMGQLCDATLPDGAGCVSAGTGDSCADAMPITLPFELSGSDFDADFSDLQEPAGTGCFVPPIGSLDDVVFEVDLAAGETLLVRELGSMESILHIQSTCGDAEPCLASDTGSELRYTADAAMTVYVIVEAAAEILSDYDIRIQIADPEVCGNGADDDLDGDVDCADSDCSGSAACAIAAGDIVITEVMANPNVVMDNYGEWFELFNTTPNDINLEGAMFMDDGADAFAVVGPLIVPAGDYALLGINGDAALNGGVDLDYEYGVAMSLGNSSDELILNVGGVEIDRIGWSLAWPFAPGVSMQLDIGSYDAGLNDDVINWCGSTATYGVGDLGTPGADNNAC